MSDQAHLSALRDPEDGICSLKSMAEIVVILMERSESGIALVGKTNFTVQQAVAQIEMEMEPLTFAVQQLNSIVIALKREIYDAENAALAGLQTDARAGPGHHSCGVH